MVLITNFTTITWVLGHWIPKKTIKPRPDFEVPTSLDPPPRVLHYSDDYLLSQEEEQLQHHNNNQNNQFNKQLFSKTNQYNINASTTSSTNYSNEHSQYPRPHTSPIHHSTTNRTTSSSGIHRKHSPSHSINSSGGSKLGNRNKTQHNNTTNNIKTNHNIHGKIRSPEVEKLVKESKNRMSELLEQEYSHTDSVIHHHTNKNSSSSNHNNNTIVTVESDENESLVYNTTPLVDRILTQNTIKPIVSNREEGISPNNIDKKNSDFLPLQVKEFNENKHEIDISTIKNDTIDMSINETNSIKMNKTSNIERCFSPDSLISATSNTTTTSTKQSTKYTNNSSKNSSKNTTKNTTKISKIIKPKPIVSISLSDSQKNSLKNSPKNQTVSMKLVPSESYFNVLAQPLVQEQINATAAAAANNSGNMSSTSSPSKKHTTSTITTSGTAIAPRSGSPMTEAAFTAEGNRKQLAYEVCTLLLLLLLLPLLY